MVWVSSALVIEPSSARLVTPAFVALTLSDLAYFSAAGVLIAVTPLFAIGPLGSDETGVGVAMGSFSLTTLLLRPLAGRWTDRRGRRALLVGGASLFAVGVLGHYLVTGLLMLVTLRVLLGAAKALYFVAGFAALADLAPPGRAGEALSLNSLALYAGVALGPLIGQGLLRGGAISPGQEQRHWPCSQPRSPLGFLKRDPCLTPTRPRSTSCIARR